MSYVPQMRTRLVAARTVAHALADLAIGADPPSVAGSNGSAILEIAGPREDGSVDVAKL